MGETPPWRVFLAGTLLLAGVLAPGRGWAAVGQCGPRLTPYEGYRLRDVRLESPFPFVRVFRGLLDPLRSTLPERGEALRETTVADTLERLDGAIRRAPVLVDAPAAVTAVVAFADRCDDEARELDLVFYVFTSRLAAGGASSWEFGETLRRDPATAAGIAAERLRLTLEPRLSFNESDQLVSGARAALVDRASGFRLSADAAGSSEYANVSLLGSGTHLLERAALWQASYAAGLRYESQPIEDDRLRQGYGFAWLSAATRPLSPLNAPVRYATQLEHGYQDSSGLVSAGFDADTSYTALKLLTGVSGGRGAHDFALSVGVELGATGGATPAWSKLLLDGAYAVRIAPRTTFFDHRALDVETRVAAGWLTPVDDGRPPHNARFFGGVRPRRFTDIPDWDLRSAPVIRGYPSNRFHARLDGGASGHERFASLNLTAALTAWRRPLLPREVYANPDFLEKIEGQKNTARAVLLQYHEARDPAMAEAERAAKDLTPTLEALSTALADVTVPDAKAEALEDCQIAVDRAQSSIRRKVIAALLNGVTGLPAVVRACGEALNGTPDRPDIRAGLDRVETLRGRIERIMTTQVRQDVAQRKADEDFAIVDRALHAFVHEINLASVDPVAIFDVADVRSGGSELVRYSVGGGLRLTLGSHASFTLGYAVNPNRGRREPSGAVVFELKIHDLIR